MMIYEKMRDALKEHPEITRISLSMYATNYWDEIVNTDINEKKKDLIILMPGFIFSSQYVFLDSTVVQVGDEYILKVYGANKEDLNDVLVFKEGGESD